jgi:hypothetical protein
MADLTLFSHNYRLRYMVAGGVCLLTAILCKTLASNADYPILHSLWHVFVFSSAFAFTSARAHGLPLVAAPLQRENEAEQEGAAGMDAGYTVGGSVSAAAAPGRRAWYCRTAEGELGAGGLALVRRHAGWLGLMGGGGMAAGKLLLVAAPGSGVGT